MTQSQFYDYFVALSQEQKLRLLLLVLHEITIENRVLKAPEVSEELRHLRNELQHWLVGYLLDLTSSKPCVTPLDMAKGIVNGVTLGEAKLCLHYAVERMHSQQQEG